MNGETVVYVVDDDTAVRESLEALLLAAETEARVECYGTGTAFLEACDSDANGCVLLDVHMPNMGGLDVQRQLQARESSLSVIIITGHGDVPMAVEAMRAGAFHFIEKPFSNDDLVATVTGAIANSKTAAANKATATPTTRNRRRTASASSRPNAAVSRPSARPTRVSPAPTRRNRAQ